MIAGVCICEESENGQGIWKTKEKLWSAIRQIVAPKIKRQKLSDCKLGFLIRGYCDPEPDSPEGWQAPVAAEFWVYAGLQYWQPVRPTFRMMYPTRLELDELGRQPLTARHSHMTNFELAAEMLSEDVDL